MNKIYLIITSGGLYEDRWERIEKAFCDKEKAEQFKDESNENLRKCRYKEELKSKRGKDFDYEILYETYDAEIKEISIE